jgi:5,5'-dehydrodivanillate O-demethylase
VVTDTEASVANRDIYSTKPGTLAGRYLRTFWQPVARSQDVVAGRAYPVQIMSEMLTVYRGSSGQAHVTQFSCPHRLTQLSAGWVEEDSIRCRYHGWKYGSDGTCEERPGEDQALNSRVHLQTYPVREYLGLIFTFIGEGEPPSLRRFPELEQEGVLETGTVEIWPCNYFNRLENACDVMHLAFTHRESLGRAGFQWRLEPPTISCVETDYGVRSGEERPGKPINYAHFHMPNINQVPAYGRIEGSMEDAATLRGSRIFWRVPIDDENCVSYVVDYFPLHGEKAEAYRSRRRESQESGLGSVNATAASVLRGETRIEDMDTSLSTYKMFWIEDYTVQVGQRPISEERHERLGNQDKGLVMLRKLWRRELKALAEGKPLTKWATPESLSNMGETSAG